MLAMVVVRDNLVEQVKLFRDKNNALSYTINFVRQCDPNFLGILNIDESYRKDDLSISLTETC